VQVDLSQLFTPEVALPLQCRSENGQTRGEIISAASGRDRRGGDNS